MERSDVLLRPGAESDRAAALARSEVTVLRASAAAAGVAHAAVRLACVLLCTGKAIPLGHLGHLEVSS